MREPVGQEENLKEHPCFRKKGISHKKRNLEVAIREQRGGQGGREVRKAWGSRSTVSNVAERFRRVEAKMWPVQRFLGPSGRLAQGCW